MPALSFIISASINLIIGIMGKPLLKSEGLATHNSLVFLLLLGTGALGTSALHWAEVKPPRGSKIQLYNVTLLTPVYTKLYG